MMQIKELDVVELIRDLPKASLREGDVGTVVFVYRPDVFEVEFVTATGKTLALETITRSDVRPAADNDLKV